MASRASQPAAPLVSFVALDLETTGLDPGRDRIIEVGAVRFTLADPGATYETFVDPGLALSATVTRITGIDDAQLVGAPSFNAVRLDLESFLGDAAIVGHNIAFDLAFLANAGLEPPGLALDTFELSALLAPGEREHNLEVVAVRLGVQATAHHRALADADTSRRVFLKLVQQARALPPDLLADLVALGAGADWPLARLLQSLAPPRTPAPLPRLPTPLPRPRRRRPAAAPPRPSRARRSRNSKRAPSKKSPPPLPSPVPRGKVRLPPCPRSCPGPCPRSRQRSSRWSSRCGRWPPAPTTLRPSAPSNSAPTRSA